MNLRRPKLGVIKEKCGFGSAITGVRWSADSLSNEATYVSFSNVTVADFGASAASDNGVTERDVIFPLRHCQQTMSHDEEVAGYHTRS